MMLAGMIIGCVFLGIYSYPVIEGYLLLNRIALKILSGNDIKSALRRKLHKKTGLNTHFIDHIGMPNLQAVLRLAMTEIGRAFYSLMGVYLLFGVIALLTASCACSRYLIGGFIGATVTFLYVYLLRVNAVFTISKAIKKLEQGGK